MLDSTLRKALANSPLPAAQGKPVRLALLGSCTLSHLHPAIRVAGLRRDIPIEVYENNFGQYWQELSDTTSDLYAFGPTMVLFALDGRHLAAGVEAGFDDTAAASALTEMKLRLRTCWRMAREAFHCPIIQQTALPVHLPLMGGNEHRLHGSAAHFIFRLNHELRAMADEEGVEILALDALAARNGIKAWHDVELWHRAKQEIAPRAAPAYGEAVGRVIAAAQGRSAKCLVLDLDNTLWGGVIGDDGMDGIVLGQGSALGEAFVAFQAYAKDLMRRGVILAVCSKNDEVNAVEPFDDHPEMVLRRSDIACFVANWQDKATNIRTIAEQLNIGLDSIVFVDDNPFERALVRQELPMVMTPEVGEDPATYAETLADAGYFESLVITDDDRARSAQYQGNLRRAALQAASTDLPSYLRGLEMRLLWRPFDAIGLSRTVQLINKTNQFNLTTRRYTEDDVLSIMADRRAFGLQLRLLDRFGDNGVIAIVVGRLISETDMLIDTWLMSCRVLGRQVESTTLNLIAAQARTLGATRLVGIYVPTKKNGMVKDHYARLGFSMVAADPSGASRGVLDLARFTPADTFIDVCEG
jgi:FkbH-like protein